MKNTIIDNQTIVIIFAFLVTIIVTIIGALYSSIYSLAITGVFLFVIFYLMNFKRFFWCFILILPFLPSYFSFKISDAIPLISGIRILFLFFIIDQLLIKRRIQTLVGTIKKDKFKIFIFIYGISIVFTGLYHFTIGDKTALIGSISILIEDVLFYYLILMNIQIEKSKLDKQFINKFLHTICISAFILSILGIVEYLTSFNVFTLLETSNVEGVSSSTYIRQGNLRISTSFSHSLGYGLYLLLLIPIAYFQYKNSSKRNSRNFYLTLTLLLLINMLLTSSRSTLIAFFVSLVFYFLMSNLRKKLNLFLLICFFIIPLLGFSITPMAEEIPVLSIVGKNVKALSDTLLGTTYIDEYGSNSDPFIYRETLIQYAFSLNGSENILGKGIGFIRSQPLVFDIPELNPYGPTISYSVDNFFINQKLEIGWIGLITTILLFASIIYFAFKHRKEQNIYLIFLVSLIGYTCELFMVNSLDTLKYFWIITALLSAFSSNKSINLLNRSVPK